MHPSKLRLKRFLVALFAISLCLGNLPFAGKASALDLDTTQSNAPAEALATLAALSLNASDLPEDFARAEIGQVDSSNYTQPLNPSVFGTMSACSDNNVRSSNQRKYDCSQVFNFIVGYGFSGNVPSATAFIANYLYQFASSDEAKIAAETMAYSFHHDLATATFLEKFSAEEPQYTKAIKFVGDLGDVVYWYISAKDKNVSMLIVHGIDEKLSSEVFSNAISKLEQKTTHAITIRQVFLPFISDSTLPDQTKAAQVDGWQTAYGISIAFWTVYPHYAAKFSGKNGRSQYYTGPSGTPPGFSGWTWYNDYGRNQLLIDSSWRLTHYPESHNVSYYHAYLDCPC